MIRFEVTGATPEEFAENAMKAWGLLAIGLQQVMSATSPTTSPSPQAMLMPSTSSSGEMHGSESSSTASKADEVSEGVVDFAMEMDRRGGLILEKIEERERKKVHSDKVDDLFMEQKTADPAPEAVGTKASSMEKKTKAPKLDDLKTRLSEVIVAATERWDQKRANAYARQLIGRFGAKLSDVKPADYEFFMKLSDGYLSGEMPETVE